MKYCQYCGKQMAEDALVCPHCGQAVPGAISNDQAKSNIPQPNEDVENVPSHTEATDTIPNPAANHHRTGGQNRLAKKDNGSFGWAILGFFIPLVGLILFLVWRKETPKNANSAGIGALVGVVSTIVYWISIAIATGLAH